MNNKPMKGIDFVVAGVIRTERKSYAILVDETTSLYFPIHCGEAQAILIENIITDKCEFDIEYYGLYFSFLSMFKAHDMFPSQISFTIGKNGSASCSMDVTEENELGFKVSRVPLLTADAVILCAIGKMSIVIYGEADTEFIFKINKDVSKQNVFQFICDDILKAERLIAIDSGEE